MLKLIKGRAGSGKTRYIMDELVSRAKRGEDGLVLIVPEQFSFECERMLLRLLSAAEARKIEVLSFSRMADKLIDECGYSRRFIDKGKQAVAMSVALDSLSDELELYKSHNGRYEFVDRLLSVMSELRYNCVTSQDIADARAVVKSSVLKQKLSEIGLIRQTYSQVVSDMLYDYDDKLDVLYELVLKSGFFKGKTVALDSFERLTRQTMKIVSVISQHAKDVMVTICSDAESVGGDLSLFSCGDRIEDSLRDMAKNCCIPMADCVVLDGSPRFESPELSWLEKNIFSVNRASYEGECRNIEICTARDIYDECSWVARRIKSLLYKDGMRARDIAVIYRNDSYADALSAALKRYEVPVFEDNRQPFSTQPLLVFVKHLFSAVRSGFKSEEIFKYLKSDLAGFSTEEISQLENYVYVWQISGSKWDKEWVDNPRGYEEKESYDDAELEKINKLRKRAIEPLKRFRSECKDATALGISTAIYKLFDEIGVKKGLLKLAVSLYDQGERELALQQDLAWRFVMKSLDDMVSLIGDKKISLENYDMYFNFLVRSADFGVIPSGLDEVAVGNANRIKTVNPRVVFVVGLNEGEFPKTQSSGGAFSDFERKELSGRNVKLLDNGEHIISEERFYTYSALCCASERVFASYSRMSAGGGLLSPSEAIGQLQSLFPDLKLRSTTEENDLDYVLSKDAAFEMLAGKWTEKTALVMALKGYFAPTKKYSSVMKALDKISEKKDFGFENPSAAKDFFHKEIYISASKAEEFAKCPFKYFCRYGMKVEKRTVARLDSMKSGLVVHHVMEKLFEDFKNKMDDLRETKIEDLKLRIDEIMDEYLEKVMGGAAGKTSRFMFLFRRLKVIIYSVVERTIEEFKNSKFEFDAFELKIDEGKDVTPLELPLTDGKICLKGSVDRVDTYKTVEKDEKGNEREVTYVKVVDYKTGTKDFKLSDVLNGLNMQMLIYLDCICKNGGVLYGNVRPAGVLYMRSQRDYETLKGDEVKKKPVTRMEGLVVENREIICAMEADIQGRFIPVVEKERKSKKKGEPPVIYLDGSLATAGQMGVLLNKIEEKLIEMGEALHEGKLPANPLGRNVDELPCEYCDYRSVCLRTEGFKQQYGYSKDEIKEILNGGVN